ncbi:hypothetical protein Hanom_Chr15g01391891 [Helianthus anomalus]
MENAKLCFSAGRHFFFLFFLGSSLGGPTRVYFTIPFSILFLRTFFLSLKCIYLFIPANIGLRAFCPLSLNNTKQDICCGGFAAYYNVNGVRGEVGSMPFPILLGWLFYWLPSPSV